MLSARVAASERLTPALAWGPVVVWLAAIFLLCVSAIRTAPPATQVSTWWPAAGVSVGLLLLSRRTRWPAVLAALMLVTALGNAAGGRPIVVAVLFGAANATEALVIAALLTRRGWRSARLDELADVRLLVVSTAAGAGLLGLLGASVVHVVEDGSFGAAFRASSASHAASDLVVVSLIILVTNRGPGDASVRAWVRPGVGRIEVVLQLLAMTLLVLVVFVPESGWPSSFLLYPVCVWAALRLTPLAAMVEVLGVAVVAAGFSSAGRGPFGGLATASASTPTFGALLQAFIATSALITLSLAISVRQRQAALDAVLHEQEFTGSLVDTTRALLLVLDHDLRVVGVNRAAAAASGRHAAELIGRAPWETVLLPEDEVRVRALVSAGSREETDLAWRSVSSARRTVAWTAGGLGGPERAVLMTGIDVTARRDSEKLLRTLLDASVGTAILGLSFTGRVVFASAGAQRILGYTTAELQGGMHVIDLCDVTELRSRAAVAGRLPGFAALLALTAGRSRDDRHDWTWMRRDGSPVTVSLTVDRTGLEETQVSYVCVVEDVSDRRRTEEELRETIARERRELEHLQELDRMTSTFVASVSHELRTPLTSVLTYSHLLGAAPREPLTSRQQHLVSRIERNGRRLLAMVEDLLTLAQVEAGPGRVEGLPLDLRDVVAGAIELISDGLVGRELRMALPDDGPCPTVGDSAQLERVVVNLLSNAIKFTPDGGEVRVECLAEPGGCLLRVTDTGVGIPSEDVGHVFEPFFRSANVSESRVPGTGLGLAIVSGVVEAHGGTVICRSAQGSGTVVEVRLPSADAGSAAGPSGGGVVDV